VFFGDQVYGSEIVRFAESAPVLPWATRIKVAIAAARGLSFLHDAEPQVIYRDFKASNILLDSVYMLKNYFFSFMG